MVHSTHAARQSSSGKRQGPFFPSSLLSINVDVSPVWTLQYHRCDAARSIFLPKLVAVVAIACPRTYPLTTLVVVVGTDTLEVGEDEAMPNMSRLRVHPAIVAWRDALWWEDLTALS
jgi:hypothetical protein